MNDVATEDIEHVDAEIKQCPHCEATVKAPFPSDLHGPLQYGDGLTAYVINLLVRQMVARNRIQQLLASMINVTLSEASLLKFILRLQQSLGQWEISTKDALFTLPAMVALLFMTAGLPILPTHIAAMPWAANMKRLLTETCVKVSKSGQKELSANDYANVQKRFRNILTRGGKELPPIPPKPSGKRGKIATSDTHNLWERLKANEQAVWLFANHGEQRC